MRWLREILVIALQCQRLSAHQNAFALNVALCRVGYDWVGMVSVGKMTIMCKSRDMENGPQGVLLNTPVKGPVRHVDNTKNPKMSLPCCQDGRLT